jgi:sulfite reductase (NADPH) flavoprotein alpha-component
LPQAKKVYVQDRLRETSDLVWSLIHEQGAHFYVCGDASSMAGAVEKELLNVISARLPGVKGGVKEGQKASEAAAAYLEELSKTGRYQRDVWY